MIEDLILSIVTHAAVFYAGYKYGIHTAVMRIVANLIKDPDTINQVMKQYQTVIDEAKLEESGEIAVTVEWRDNQCYLYRVDNGEFLAQGISVAAAVDNCRQFDNGIVCRVTAEMVDKPQ